MVKLRLKRMGSKYNAFYRIVAADARAPRDGKYIEEIGYYNPRSKEIRVNNELKDKWLAQGAIPSSTVKNLFTKVTSLKISSNEVGVLPSKAKKPKRPVPQAALVQEEATTTEAPDAVQAPAQVATAAGTSPEKEQAPPK